MKVCHVVPSLQLQHGGPSKSVLALCRALARAGHEVELFATAPDAPVHGTLETSENLRVQVFHRDWPTAIVRSAGMRRALARSEAEVFHHHALWLRTLHYTADAARRRRAPLVLSPRGMMSSWAWRHHRRRKAVAASLIHPGAFHAATAWHVTSPEEAREVANLGFHQRSCIAPNGVDAPSEAELERSIAHWHEQCPETKSRPTAVFYSRFHQKKRVIELMDAWLEWARPDWLLLLVGIPEEYTPEMLESYAHRMSGGGRIRAFDGADRPPPYGVASLFVLPSHNENFGMAIAEALAYGVPALVTDTTPWSDVNAEKAGWCVPWPEYGPALRDATHLSAESLADRGRRGRAWVLQNYSWDRSAGILGQLYSELLNRTTVT